MKKILTFIPLGIGISSAFLYLYNIVYFRVINNAATLSLILSNIRVYLYVSIAGFVIYFLIKLLDVLTMRLKILPVQTKSEGEPKVYSDDFEFNNTYNDEESPISLNELDNNSVNDEIIESQLKLLSSNEKESIKEIKEEQIPVEKIVIKDNTYCYKCGSLVEEDDLYCKSCGTLLRKNKHTLLKDIINVIEIVILLLIIYFSLSMLFDYKESIDSNFTSPFKISMTK